MRLLFAEDDRSLCKAMKTILEHAGYAVDIVHNGQDALDYAAGYNYDGIILDWMMPAPDGLEVLRQLRGRGISVPCLMLTARDAVEDRVSGLDAGADDYLPKPFASSELLARIRAMLRRKEDFRQDAMNFANVTLDRQSMVIACGEKNAKLNNKAFQLMEMLMEHPGRVYSVDQIMERVWGWDAEAEMNALWVTISNLRKVLNEIGAGLQIRATRGVGYSLEETA
ncbi:MAG: response regulator transcription factor [Clostridia bacterium]|nr:response regulator transcription factor [Clostridia bacterium]